MTPGQRLGLGILIFASANCIIFWISGNLAFTIVAYIVMVYGFFRLADGAWPKA